jgi:carboxyl-terminal processing protease
LIGLITCLAFTIACGGSQGGTNAFCEDLNLRAQPSGLTLAVPLASAVYAAENVLSELYVDPVDSAALLAEAWRGSEAYLRSKGQMDLNLTAPQRGDSELQIRAGFEALQRAGEGRVDPGLLSDAALSAMAASLRDDHTGYLSRRSLAASERNQVLAFGFRGIFTPAGLLVSDILPASPADGAGLRRGDLVRSINGQPFNSRRLAVPVDLTQPVAFAVSRGGMEASFVVHMTVTELPWHRFELLEGNIGYIRLYEFPSIASCDAFTAFRRGIDEAISELEANGARAWLIDLRGNGGGSILAAAYVTGRLGYEGLLATLRDRYANRTPFETIGTNLTGDSPMAILIDSGSASASEITSYVLQSERDAHILGTQSAGSVVASITVPVAGGAMAVTVSRVDIGPGNHILDGTGITPNSRVELDAGLMIREGRDSQIEAALAHLRRQLGR